MTIAQWRNMGYQNDPNHESFHILIRLGIQNKREFLCKVIEAETEPEKNMDEGKDTHEESKASSSSDFDTQTNSDLERETEQLVPGKDPVSIQNSMANTNEDEIMAQLGLQLQDKRREMAMYLPRESHDRATTKAFFLILALHFVFI